MAPTITVRFEQDAGVFFPGQTVAGNVHVNNNKKRKCEGISIKFHGNARVQFSETTTVHRDGKSETVTKNYRASEEYYKSQYYLWTDTSQELAPGTYQFPFSFIIPQNTPASFQSKFGGVVHLCEATIKIPLSRDVYCKRPFSVNSLLDLNANPANMAPQTQQGLKTLCCLCCRNGPITLVVRLNRTGYVPGEDIVISVECSNNSNRKITSTKAELYMNVLLMAVGRNRVEKYRLMQLTQPEVAKGEDCVWDGHRIRIPPLPASGLVGCNIINVDYQLKFTLTPQRPATSLTLDFPINIGSIPLRDTFQIFSNEPQYQPVAGPSGFVAPDPISTKGMAPQPPELPPAYSPQRFPGMDQYPTMPPPSYCQAVSEDLKKGVAGLPADADGSNQEPSAPEEDFTPTYVSYTLTRQ